MFREASDNIIGHSREWLQFFLESITARHRFTTTMTVTHLQQGKNKQIIDKPHRLNNFHFNMSDVIAIVIIHVCSKMEYLFLFEKVYFSFEVRDFVNLMTGIEFIKTTFV
jgi:hypothetical protein